MSYTFIDKDFIDFLDESFEYGTKKVRELRLSKEERDFIELLYPNAVISKMSEECKDGKTWYKVQL